MKMYKKILLTVVKLLAKHFSLGLLGEVRGNLSCMIQ